MKKLSELSDAEFARIVIERVHRDQQSLADQRAEALSAFRMAAGDQWDPEDRASLEIQGRPAVVFNRIDTAIEAVAGFESTNSQDILPVLRGVGSQPVDEALAGALQYIRDESNAPDEESEALRDAMIAGVGCLGLRIDDWSEDDPQIRIEHVDFFEVGWDSAAERRNLIDARWCWRIKRLSWDEVEATWPNAAERIKAEPFQNQNDSAFLSLFADDRPATLVDTNLNRLYEGLGTIQSGEPMAEGLLTLEYYWYEIDRRFQILDETSGQVVGFTEEQFNALPEKPPPESFRETHALTHHQAFLWGTEVLERSLSFSQKGFPLLFLTVKRDRAQRRWYGIVRNIVDPQRWANRFFSLIIDIIARNTKGGAFAEEDVFVDIRRAEADWSKSSPLILLKRGGLGRILERQPAQFPAGVERMMAFAMESVRDISGINVEFLGQANRAQAGILETERKRSAVTILASLFNNLRLLRKREGKLLLDLIPKFLPPDLLIRIQGGGPGEFRVEALQEIYTRNSLLKYDIVVDEMPHSTSVRERAWFAIQQILPTLLKSGVPVPPEAIDYMPIPRKLAERWKAALQPIFEGFIRQSSMAAQAQSPNLSAEEAQAGLASQEGPPALVTGSPQNINEQEALLQSQVQRNA